MIFSFSSMARLKKTWISKGKRRNKKITKRSTDIKHVPKEEYSECTTEQKIDIVKQEPIEVTIECVNDEESKSDEKIDIVKQEPIEVTIEYVDDGKKDYEESKSDEEVWIVRKQLCRGCHSDGAFWSLQTTTEGVAYGDLLQTYFNIQLCPVSEDEFALSAICALCAARLREARAFSLQAHAAEERFTQWYTQNRIRALCKEVEVKEDVPKENNEVDDFEITDDVQADATNSNMGNPESSIDELAPAIKNNKQKSKSSSKKSLCKEVEVKEDVPKENNEVFQLLPSDYERVGRLYKCSHCDKLFSKWGLHGHVKNMRREPKYTCPHCDKTFMKLEELRSHKYVEHSILKYYTPSASEFETVGNSYKCTRCEKIYNKFYRLRKHVMYIHLKLPRYYCSHCDKTFHSMTSYKKHKLDEHSIDERLKCNACDWFTYHKKCEFKKHMNVFHMLGKKISCTECDYTCYSERALKKHAIKHSTVKNYHCKYCKKSFLRKTNLTYHERIHTQDKRSVCDVCGQAFVQRASLKYHLEKHHPEVH